MNAIRPAASLELLVENVHCAGCISKIERSVASLPGVTSARFNMSTHQLKVDVCDSAIDCANVAETSPRERNAKQRRPSIMERAE